MSGEFVGIVDHGIWHLFVRIALEEGEDKLQYRVEGNKTIVWNENYTMDYDGLPEPHFLFPLAGENPFYKTELDDFCTYNYDENVRISIRLVDFFCSNQLPFNLEWRKLLKYDIINLSEEYPVEVIGTFAENNSIPIISNDGGSFVEFLATVKRSDAESGLLDDGVLIDEHLYKIIATEHDFVDSGYMAFDDDWTDATINDLENDSRLRAIDSLCSSLMVCDDTVTDAVAVLSSLRGENCDFLKVSEINVTSLRKLKNRYDYVVIGDAMCHPMFEMTHIKTLLMDTLRPHGLLIGYRRGSAWPRVQTPSLNQVGYMSWDGGHDVSYDYPATKVCQAWERVGYARFQGAKSEGPDIMSDTNLYDQFSISRFPLGYFSSIEGEDVNLSFCAPEDDDSPNVYIGIRHSLSKAVPVIGGLGFLYRAKGSVVFIDLNDMRRYRIDCSEDMHRAIEGRHVLVAKSLSQKMKWFGEYKLQYIDSRGPDLPQSWEARRNVVNCYPCPFKTSVFHWDGVRVYDAPLKSQGGFGKVRIIDWREYLRDWVDDMVAYIVHGDLSIDTGKRGAKKIGSKRWALIGTIMRIKRDYPLHLPVSKSMVDMYVEKAHGRSMPLLDFALRSVLSSFGWNSLNMAHYVDVKWGNDRDTALKKWQIISQGQTKRKW